MAELRFKKPCNDCPFRRNAAPGWLGASGPEWFVQIALSDYPTGAPCHQTVNYDDPDWEETVIEGMVSACAGSLIFARNLGKMPRDSKECAAVQSVEPDREGVFTSPQEFIDYHNNAPARSWEF